MTITTRMNTISRTFLLLLGLIFAVSMMPTMAMLMGRTKPLKAALDKRLADKSKTLSHHRREGEIRHQQKQSNNDIHEAESKKQPSHYDRKMSKWEKMVKDGSNSVSPTAAAATDTSMKQRRSIKEKPSLTKKRRFSGSSAAVIAATSADPRAEKLRAHYKKDRKREMLSKDVASPPNDGSLATGYPSSSLNRQPKDTGGFKRKKNDVPTQKQGVGIGSSKPQRRYVMAQQKETNLFPPKEKDYYRHDGYPKVLSKTKSETVYGTIHKTSGNSLDAEDSSSFPPDFRDLQSNQNSRECTDDDIPIPTNGTLIIASTRNTPLAPRCSDPSRRSRSRWYTVIGDDTVMEATTCSDETRYDTMLGLYEGSCDDLTCLYENDDNSQCDDWLTSSITWFAESGKTYKIQVFGYSGDTGRFGLTVTSKSIIPSSNDVCLDDDPPIPTNGTVMVGSTHVANFSDSCFSEYNGPVQSLWYTVIGNDTLLEATTCTDETGEYGYDTMIALYEGSCGNLTCLRENDQNPACADWFTSSVTWFAEADKVYHLQVYGFGGGIGTFGLSVAPTIDMSPSNDICLDDDVPIPINGSVIIGSTVLAEPSDSCSSVLPVQSLWYTVVGNGTFVQATTCTDETGEYGYDTRLALYEGSCGDLSCTDENDDYSACDYGLSSSVSWFAELDKIYHLQVSGYGGGVGTFGLTVAPAIDLTPPNDVCLDDDVPIEANGTVVVGSNELSEYSETCPGYGDRVQSLWYTVIGNDTTLEASTCTDETEGYDTILALYEGSCDNRTCLAENDDGGGSCPQNGYASTLLWFGEMNKTYHLQVFGFFGFTGTFGLTVTPRPDLIPPPNDACHDDDTPVPTNGTDIFGSTLLAGYSDTCSFLFDGQVKSLWYTVVGNNTFLEASTCTDETYGLDTILILYEGSCGNLTCMGVNDNTDSCDFQLASHLSWFAEEGKVYHLQVLDFYQDTGSFGLTVSPSSDVPPPNDICLDDDLPLPTNGTLVTGSLAGAGFSDTCSIGLDAGRVQSLWYTVIGNGTDLKASTCTDETGNFDTVIALYEGSCDNLTCVAERDDTFLCDNVYATSISWFAELGKVYHLQVYGYPYSNGDFGLTVEETDLRLDACEEIAAQLEYFDDVSCECTVDGEGASLACLSPCTFCNSIAPETCTAYVLGAYFDASGEIVSVSNEWEYISGRNETLRVDYSNCTNGCTTCEVSIDDEMCTSCELGYFDDDLIVDCSNVIPGETINTEEYPDLDEGILQPLYWDNFNECIRDPFEACQAFLELVGEDDICTCLPLGEDYVLEYCDAFQSDCSFCNTDGSVCATNETTGYVYDERGQDNGFLEQVDFFRGLDGTFSIIDFRYDECVAMYNGVRCNNCTSYPYCADSSGYSDWIDGYSIDCENVEAGAVVDACDGEDGMTDSFLQYVTDDAFDECLPPGASGEDECQRELEFEVGSQHVECACTETSTGTFKMGCRDLSCLYCDTDDTMCIIDTYGAEYSSVGQFLSTFEGYDFVLGQANSVEFEINYNTDNLTRTCTLSVNGQECDVCELCEYTGEFGFTNFGPSVHCENLGFGSINTCDPNATTVSGQFNPFLPEVDDAFDECIAINGALPETASPSDIASETPTMTPSLVPSMMPSPAATTTTPSTVVPAEANQDTDDSAGTVAGMNNISSVFLSMVVLFVFGTTMIVV